MNKNFKIKIKKSVVEEMTEIKFEDWDIAEYETMDEFASDDLYEDYPELRNESFEVIREEKEDHFLYEFTLLS